MHLSQSSASHPREPGIFDGGHQKATLGNLELFHSQWEQHVSWHLSLPSEGNESGSQAGVGGHRVP